jgi:hypothetical protein
LKGAKVMTIENKGNSEASASNSGAANAFITPSPTVNPLERPRTKGELAYLTIAHLADAYPESELLRVTTDLEATSVTAIGAVPKIRAARADVLRKIPHHDMTYFDLFEAIAWALAYVCAQVNATEEENRALTAQAESIKSKINELKNFLVNHAKAADINMTALRKIGTEFGYKALLSDAGTVLELLLQNWDELASKLPADAPSPQAFDQEVADFRMAMGRKEQDPDGPRQELIRRRRVNTLFRHAVANIREALIYTYGESKVGDYIPGFSNASGKSTSRNTDGEGEPSSSSDSDVTQDLTSAARRPSGFVVNNPEKLPITDPFISEEDDKQESA